MTQIKGKAVMVTGGASGIGKIMGRMALEKGARCLVIWDINEDSIEKTKTEFAGKGRVEGFQVDVSDSERVKSCFEKTTQLCGDIDILINSAGIVTGNKGHICNIASAAGMISNPKMSVHVASKWAVIGWSDSVRIELKEAKSDVHFTTVAPYYINTGMFDGVESKIFPILDPENTSRKILRAIERNRDFKGIPWEFHFIRFWQGLLPTSWFDTIFGKWVGIFSAMDHFTGRRK